MEGIAGRTAPLIFFLINIAAVLPAREVCIQNVLAPQRRKRNLLGVEYNGTATWFAEQVLLARACAKV